MTAALCPSRATDIYNTSIVIKTVTSMQSGGTQDGSKTIEINSKGKILSIAFTEDGKQVWSGGEEGFLRQWQVNDAREVGEAIQVDSEGGTEIFSAVLSPDRKRLVCGLRFPNGSTGKAWVGVWDAQTREKVLDIHGHTSSVVSVDVSPDSTKFATGSCDKLAFIWSMVTGEQLVGPLRHDGYVATVRFSPNGDRLATAVFKNPGAESIRIYKSDNGHQLLDIPFKAQSYPSSSFTWSTDGGQLFAVAYGEVKCFDTSSRAVLSKWSVHNGEGPTSIVLACNQKFAVVSAYDSLSFWDTSTHKQIGTVVKQASTVWSMALSPNDDRVAIGHENGKITFRSLHDILPGSYFTVNLPLMYISDAAFKFWTEGNLTRVEELLTQEILHPSNPFHHARALAHRALVRTRSKQWNTAVDDAKMSIKIQSSLVGHVALAMGRAGSGEYESATRDFDL
ncbi:WD40 repeat-like protein, partial [Imleria badia]